MNSASEPRPSPTEPPHAEQSERPRPVVAVAGSQPATETRGERFSRKAHHTGLYLYTGLAVALLVVLIALVIANTDRVKVSWVVGSASVSLVWLVIFSAILGLLLGIVLGALFRWRTRPPRS